MGISFMQNKHHSKYVGVTWGKTNKKWLAWTKKDGITKWHGSHDTEKEAARARNAAMIDRFGFDPHPNVILEPSERVTLFSSTGDAEHLIPRLPHIKRTGLSKLYIHSKPGESKDAAMARVKGLCPLLRDQPYFHEVLIQNNVACEVDLDATEPCAETEPWLTVQPIRLCRVVIHRKSVFMPQPAPEWKVICDQYGSDCVFLGTRTAMQIFRSQTGIDVLTFKTPKNLLEAAQFIAGSELFIGNKSALSEIAKGLGVRTVMEWTEEFSRLVHTIFRSEITVIPIASPSN